MSSPELTRSVVERYVELIAKGTGAQIAALYAEHGSVEDPVGTGPRAGREALEEFYDRAAAMDSTTELLALRVAGNEAAAHFRVVSRTGGRTYTCEPIDTFVVDDEGRIVTMRAYWGPGDLKG
ncbi:nuclear transport factor 2 family protein [Streptomyces sp. NPDC015220]|uniref:nuclear transport factor 2 family protein n=1 Tax=Streptomyces sp. NPDC015220 TaxID=3364947 RepID=UPI0036F66736